ncbi:MAG: hypothetical protein V4446_07120 [Pseudomonadota bacterium]
MSTARQTKRYAAFQCRVGDVAHRHLAVHQACWLIGLEASGTGMD